MGERERASPVSQELEELFPRLRGVEYEITSPAQPDYNCVAWAAGDSSRWWEPDEFHLYYWPDGVARRLAVDALVDAFRLLGFEVCEDLYFEQGWEKVAIFARADGVPTHAARQLRDGTWTSKLGKLEDINHPELDDVGGAAYGSPLVILRRHRSGT